MTVLTGFEGKLYFEDQFVGRCRNWSVTVNRDALETTQLGVSDRTYTLGLRGATGTATLLYDNGKQETPASSSAVGQHALLNSIFDDINCQQSTKDPSKLAFQFDRCFKDNIDGDDDGSLHFYGYITSMTHSVSVGEVQTCNITFQVTGKLQTKAYTGSATEPYPN